MTDLASLVVRMQADNSQYVKALDTATKRLSQFQKDQDDLLGDIAKKFAAAFTVDRIVEFSKSAVESAAQLQKFSQSAGVSASQLSSLGIAMAGSGVDTDALSTAFKKLNVAASDAAGDATSKSGEAFRLLGINVKDANGNVKDAATLNYEVADAFANTADGANKVAIAVALYGREGQAMIPTLDQGSAALKAQQQAAIDAGAALDDKTAAAAEEAEHKFAQLAQTIQGQLRNSIIVALIPALNDVADAFSGLTNNSTLFSLIGQTISVAFRGAASILLELGREVETVTTAFKGVGAYAAAAAQAVSGNFAAAKSIIADFSAENDAVQKKYADAQAKLWDGAADAQIEAAKKGAEGAEAAANKQQPGSLAALAKSDEADKALTKFAEGLRVQAQSFGLGAVAATQYKLSVGELAEQLKVAGDAGKKAAAEAIEYAKAFQFKVDTKTGKDLVDSLTEQSAKLNQSDVAAFNYKISAGELGQALDRLAQSGLNLRPALVTLNNQLIDEKDQRSLQALNDELDKMNGKLVEAAQHAFYLQNESLTQNLTDRGDTAGLAKVAQLRDATTAQAEYDEQVQAGQRIEAAYAATVAQVNLEQAQGALTALQAQEQLNDAQAKEVTQLQSIVAAEKQIADTSGLVKLQEQTQAAQTSLVNLQKTLTDSSINAQIRNDLETSIEQPLLDVETGSKKAKDAFSDFVKSLQRDLLSIANKDIAQQLFGQGGPGGGLSSLLGGIFGGGSGGSSGGGLLGGLSNLFGFGGPSIASSGAAAAGETSEHLLNSIPLNLPGLAAGGTVGPKSFALVGENGPELAYSGAKDLHIQPMSSARAGVTQSNTFVLQAPGGTITRQSQAQAAAEAARQLSVAARRAGYT